MIEIKIRQTLFPKVLSNSPRNLAIRHLVNLLLDQWPGRLLLPYFFH